jgi:hypothetical protein
MSLGSARWTITGDDNNFNSHKGGVENPKYAHIRIKIRLAAYVA